jgi:hypothetical protein
MIKIFVSMPPISSLSVPTGSAASLSSRFTVSIVTRSHQFFDRESDIGSRKSTAFAQNASHLAPSLHITGCSLDVLSVEWSSQFVSPFDCLFCAGARVDVGSSGRFAQSVPIIAGCPSCDAARRSPHRPSKSDITICAAWAFYLFDFAHEEGSGDAVEVEVGRSVFVRTFSLTKL